MKRLAPITILLLAVACGDKDDPASSASATGDSTTSDTGDSTTSDTATTGTSQGSNSDSATTSGTTTSDPSTSSTTTDSSGSSGGGFINEPDGGVTGQCDPMAQDCPDGEKCTAYSTDGAAPPASPWDANKCVPVTGSLQEGDLCDINGGKYTGDDKCDVGLICLLTDDDGIGGACVEFCDTNMQCSNPSANCAVYNDGSLPICLTDCDPLLQDCPDGQGCYASAAGDGFICFKFSGMAGEGIAGDECNYVNACAPGLACLAPDAVEGCASQAGCCSPFCDLTDADPNAGCNPNEECTAWFDMGQAPPEHTDVGVCALPA